LFTVGRITAGLMEDEKPGGRSTTRCGGVAAGAAGRRPSQQKMQTWMFAFFASLRSTATAVGCSSPFEPFKERVCDRNLTTWVSGNI